MRCANLKEFKRLGKVILTVCKNMAGSGIFCSKCAAKIKAGA